MPELTEAWASAYLQILFGLLVFSIGLPAVITQLIVREDIRQITQKEHNYVWWGVWVAICLASLLFVWLFHPTGNKPDQRSLYASLVISLVAVSILLLMRLLKGYERETIIRRLRKKLIHSWQTKRTLKAPLLTNLVYLGAKGHAGREKDLVLEVLKDLLDEVRFSPDYKGDQMEQLMDGLPTILSDKEKSGNDENFNRVAFFLQEVRDGIPDDLSYSTRDRLTAKNKITYLGIESVTLGLGTAPFNFLQLAEIGNEEMVFEIGLNALKSGRFKLAVAALDKLESLAADQESFCTNRVTAYLLGLIAHFAFHSPSACRQAEMALKRIADSSSPSLSQCLIFAFNYHYEELLFSTSDSIAKLQKALGGEISGLQYRIFPNN